jgi:adenylate cyclase
MGVCLVVDDEADVERLIRQRFRHEIRDGELQFHFAQNGEEAIEVLKQHPEIDMVLTDINMPKMDGLTLLSHVQDINPIARTVVVSAYGDMENIRTSMNRGAFDFIVKPIDFDDLRATMDKTLRYVTEVKESLSSARENSILRMYVNPSIINYLQNREAGPNDAAAALKHNPARVLGENRRIHASVMFVDICGFTLLSESLSPDLIGTLLNTYFDEIAQESLLHSGSIDKFIGDAAMIVFEGEDHVVRAVETSLGILARIRGYRGKILGESAAYPGISIGINAGDMVSGNFGSASLRRLDYTVIGDAVNTAARLENAATEGQILIVEDLYEMVKDRYTCDKIGSIQLKNKTQTSLVYQVSVPGN